MITKKIRKVEDLNGMRWVYNGENFGLIQDIDRDLMKVYHFFHRGNKGLVQDMELFWISEMNLSELEFYGLKVEILKSSKLSRNEKHFLLSLQEGSVLARDKSDNLYVYTTNPIRDATVWVCPNNSRYLHVLSDFFKVKLEFITWESQKFWSKEELLELEVEE